jgi:hypothetical protein
MSRVSERLLALWNQHGRFQLLCQPTMMMMMMIRMILDLTTCATETGKTRHRRLQAPPHKEPG